MKKARHLKNSQKSEPRSDCCLQHYYYSLIIEEFLLFYFSVEISDKINMTGKKNQNIVKFEN